MALLFAFTERDERSHPIRLASNCLYLNGAPHSSYSMADAVSYNCSSYSPTILWQSVDVQFGGGEPNAGEPYYSKGLAMDS